MRSSSTSAGRRPTSAISVTAFRVKPTAWSRSVACARCFRCRTCCRCRSAEGPGSRRRHSTIGPESVGFRLTELGRVFGGDVTTCTDVAVADGASSLGDPSRVADLPAGLVSEAMATIRARLEDAIDRMRPDAEPRPVIAVGGGSFLVPDGLAGTRDTVRVPHAPVANAVGAAMAQVSGESDRVYRDVPRDKAIAAATAGARTDAIAAGRRSRHPGCRRSRGPAARLSAGKLASGAGEGSWGHRVVGPAGSGRRRRLIGPTAQCRTRASTRTGDLIGL